MRQYVKLGCQMVDLKDAQLVVADGTAELEYDPKIYESTTTKDIVFLVAEDHEADQQMLKLADDTEKDVRRFKKPATPSILRETLFPGHSKVIQSSVSSSNGDVSEPVNSPEQIDAQGRVIPLDQDRPTGQKVARFDQKSLDRTNSSRHSSRWKPHNIPVEEAVASLSLGDYFSARRNNRLARTPSSSGSAQLSAHSELSSPDPSLSAEMTSGHKEIKEAPRKIKVLIVEDNMINRKILVKILASKLVSLTT